jgi:hypothetical protein
MWCRRLVVLVSFTVLLAGPVPAQADGLLDDNDVVATANSAVDDPVGTVTSTTNNVVGTVTSTASDDPVGTVTSTANNVVGTVTSTSSGTAGSLGGAVTSTSSGTAGSVVDQTNTASQMPQASSSAGSSSGGSGGTSDANRRSAAGSHGDRKTAGRSYHTRFDRLPRRAEILIERIELGHNVRASLRRLEALLGRSPALRADLLRALRSELARLRKDGLTPAERRQMRRLIRVQRTLAPSVSGSSTLGSASALETSASLSRQGLTGIESAAISPQNEASRTGVAAAHAQREANGREANGRGAGILGLVPLPDGIDGWPSWLMTLLGVVAWLSILALAAIFLSPVRRAFRELR